MKDELLSLADKLEKIYQKISKNSTVLCALTKHLGDVI
jgi:hypothetical protein